MPLIQPQTPQQPVENQPVGRRERGTGFTNIQNLLKANVGAGQKMGSAISQNLGKKAGQLSEDVTRAGKAFQDRYDASTGKQEQALKTAEGLIPSSVEGIGGIGQMSEEDAKSIGKQLAEAKTYQGPMGIEGASQLASRGASLAGLGQLARGGSTGQGLLLQGTAGRSKPYTRGQSSLDTFLLGQDKQAQKDIKQAAAQTAGAEQKAGTLVSGAEQQAKEGSRALAGRQADILKKAAESGQAIGKYGEEQASQYVKDAARLQELIQNIALPGFDPSKIKESDKALFDRMAEFGFDVDLTVDPRERYSQLSRGLLADIASKGETAQQVGAKKLTDEQAKAFKNLALLQQQESTLLTPFDEKLFPSKEAAYAESLNALRDEQEQGLFDLQKSAFDKMLEYGWGPQGFNRNYSLEDGYRYFNNLISQFDTSQHSQSYKDWIRQQFNQLKENAQKEKLAQKGITMGDYLKSLYGINPQGSGQA